MALGDREMVTLFKMSGISGRIIENEQQAEQEIRELVRSREYGLLIVTEKIAAWSADTISRIRFSRSQVLVVEVPDKDGHLETGRTLSDYIREAVGIRI